jgi:acetyl-CoA carboxylase carboxyltransferase component
MNAFHRCIAGIIRLGAKRLHAMASATAPKRTAWLTPRGAKVLG